MDFNYIDVIAVILVVIGAFATAKAGLFRTLLEIAAYIGAGFIAKFASVPLGQYIYNTFVQEKILTKLSSILPNGSIGGEISEVVSNIKLALPDAFVKIADSFSLFPTEDVAAGANTILTINQIEQQYVMPIAIKITAAISAVVVFIISLILLQLIVKALNAVFFGRKRHGIFKKLNNLLGFVFGLIKNTIPVAIILFILIIVTPLISNEYLSGVVNASYFCNLLSQLI